MLESGFADFPTGVDVEIVPAPPHLSDMGDFADIIQPFSSAPHARFFLAPGKKGGSPKQPCYPEMIQAKMLREIWPGRILYGIRARQRATTMQRLYDSPWLESGWAEYAARLGGDFPPKLGPEACSALQFEYWRSTWYALLDLALNVGAIDEDEAIAFLKGWDGLDEGAARGQVASITLNPLNYAGVVWTHREIRRLREDLKTELDFRFDLKRFHEALMIYGRTPITLAREDIRQHLK